MKTIKLLITFVLLSLFLQPAFAIDKALLKQAKEQQQLAIGGDKDATEKAFELFSTLHKANPESTMILANLGSVETIKGRDAWMPWNKMGFVEAGLDKIDEALEMIENDSFQDSQVNNVWQSIETRNTAANTFIGLPKMFSRMESGKEELAILLSEAKFKNAPQELKNSAYSLAITMAKQNNQNDLVEKYQSLIEK